MARLSIQLMGTFQVTIDHKPVTHYRADTAQALLVDLGEWRPASARDLCVEGQRRKG